MEPLRFDGRAVLITGAGRGMGAAHARLFAERGAQVMIADAGVGLYGDADGAEPDVAEALAEALRAEGLCAIAYAADLADPAGASGAVDRTIDAFGRIDALVHNAGFTLGPMPLEREGLDRFDKQMAVNARAGFEMARQAWPHFQKQGGGRIVFVGSTAMYGLPRSTPYSTAKAAYIGLTRALAGEGAEQAIQVNLIAPAGATRMARNMPESAFRDWFLRTMRPEFVSPLVAWLCHPVCDVSGEVFIAGGGRIGRMIVQESRGVVEEAPTMESLHADRATLMEAGDVVPIPTFQSSMDLMFDTFGFSPAGESVGYATARD